MQFLKGVAAVSGTLLALLIATIVFVFLKMRADNPNYRPGTQVGYDIKVLWVWMLYSPIYWMVVLVLVGLSVWVFKRWVFKITFLAYVLTLEDPQRFASSREVGPYLGLVPKQEDSGDSQPQLGISKAGDRMLRRLLVGS